MTEWELAALAYCFDEWARSKQVIRDGAWRSHGTLAGRGWGKTAGNVASWIVPRVLDRRIRRMNLIGATDDHAYEVGIEDPYAGLIAMSPPWCRPSYRAGMLTWPNGAECRVYGAYKPSRIRGGGVDTVWCTELTTWQSGTAIEAWDMAVIKTREHDGRVLWDATSESRNELLADRVRESIADPIRYALVRGDTRENLWLSPDYIADLMHRYSMHDDDGNVLRDADGAPRLTRRGIEEITAAFTLDVAGALWRAEWIRHREPGVLRRTVVSIDPAFSQHRGSDAVGVCIAGLDDHGCFVVLDDRTSAWRWEEWGDLALDMYAMHHCDCVVVERNKGGDAVAANIRARALARRDGPRVVLLDRAHVSVPPHDPRTIYVREVTARDAKWNRAEPVAGLYEAGLAYHARALTSLEHSMRTWEPDPRAVSPNDIDAMTQAANELIDLDGRGKVADVRAMAGAARMQRAMSRQQPRSRSVLPMSSPRGRTL